MKAAFLTDTPLQLLNTVSFILSHPNYEGSDLYIVNQYRGAEQLFNNMRNSSLFLNVYFLNGYKHGITKHSLTIIGLLAPRFFLRRFRGLNIFKDRYTEIFLAYPTRLFDIIVFACNPSIINVLEDGLGSYYGDVMRDRVNSIYLWLRRILRREYQINSLFLNHPKMYRGKEGVNIECIGGAIKDSYSNKAIKKLFNTERYNTSEHRIMYINQPRADFDAYYKNKEKQLINSLTHIFGKKEICVRTHPREKDISCYEGLFIDYTGGMWELVCDELISSENIIIGNFSTAQFAPKLFYDLEPYVVFVYKILNRTVSEEYDVMVDALKSVYSEKDRVIVAKDLNDIENIFSSRNI